VAARKLAQVQARVLLQDTLLEPVLEEEVEVEDHKRVQLLGPVQVEDKLHQAQKLVREQVVEAVVHKLALVEARVLQRDTLLEPVLEEEVEAGDHKRVQLLGQVQAEDKLHQAQTLVREQAVEAVVHRLALVEAQVLQRDTLLEPVLEEEVEVGDHKRAQLLEPVQAEDKLHQVQTLVQEQAVEAVVHRLAQVEARVLQRDTLLEPVLEEEVEAGDH